MIWVIFIVFFFRSCHKAITENWSRCKNHYWCCSCSCVAERCKRQPTISVCFLLHVRYWKIHSVQQIKSSYERQSKWLWEFVARKEKNEGFLSVTSHECTGITSCWLEHTKQKPVGHDQGNTEQHHATSEYWLEPWVGRVSAQCTTWLPQTSWKRSKLVPTPHVGWQMLLYKGVRIQVKESQAKTKRF